MFCSVLGSADHRGERLWDAVCPLQSHREGPWRIHGLLWKQHTVVKWDDSTNTQRYIFGPDQADFVAENQVTSWSREDGKRNAGGREKWMTVDNVVVRYGLKYIWAFCLIMNIVIHCCLSRETTWLDIGVIVSLHLTRSHPPRLVCTNRTLSVVNTPLAPNKRKIVVSVRYQVNHGSVHCRREHIFSTVWTKVIPGSITGSVLWIMSVLKQEVYSR